MRSFLRAVASSSFKGPRISISIGIALACSVMLAYAACAGIHVPSCTARGGMWVEDITTDGSGACVRYDQLGQIQYVTVVENGGP